MPDSYVFKGASNLLKGPINQLLAFEKMIRDKDIGANYGIPKYDHDAERSYKPQVFLTFEQPDIQVPAGKHPLNGQVSFRLMEETSDTITMSKLTQIATGIKANFFGNGTPYQWDKGKKLATYHDAAQGYEINLKCRTRGDAQQLFTKVLAIQSHAFVAKNFGFHENQGELEKYPENPLPINILGEIKTPPRQRPLAEVHFRRGVCAVWANGKAVNLFDPYGEGSNALVS